MSIVSSDIKFYLSGGSSNSNPLLSLGGAISTTTQIISNTLNALFDDVSAAESSAGDTEYRCIYVKNTHATLTLTGPNVLWILTQTSGGHTFAVGFDTAAVNVAAAAVANESTAPSGVSFASPTTKAGSGLSCASIPPGQFKAIWLRRVVQAASDSDSFVSTIKIEGATL